MLAELPEADATGEIAVIYDELKTLCGIPYVSSMQRHLATRPGWLPWAWGAIRPAFVSGRAQEAGWTNAAAIERELTPLPTLDSQDQRALGVGPRDCAEIRNIALSFVRVSPTNLMFSGLVGALLRAPPGKLEPVLDVHAEVFTGNREAWQPPPMLPTLPGLINPEAASPILHSALSVFRTEVAGEAFIPGIYRMLAHWPEFLGHLAKSLGPRFTDPATTQCCASLRERIDAAVPSVLAQLPGTPRPPHPEEIPDLLEAMARYRVTSPQMVVFGTLIARCLPSEAS